MASPANLPAAPDCPVCARPMVAARDRHKDGTWHPYCMACGGKDPVTDPARTMDDDMREDMQRDHDRHQRARRDERNERKANAALLEFARTIAGMTQDGEEVDGEEFIMENDDAVSTLNSLISDARDIVKAAR